MDTTTLAFLGTALVAVVATFGVVTAQRIMHAALWMGLAFVAVAGVFLFLNAEFLAAAQVLVYVGAITTIIIFGIMLSEVADITGTSQQAQERDEGGSSLRRGVLPVITATVFTVLMVAAYVRSGWPREMPAESILDSTRAIGRELFTEYVLPFELAAILLIVALVGAIVMATKGENN